MEPSSSKIGKTFLNRIAYKNPEMAQYMNNYFHGIINNLDTMIKHSSPDPDFASSEHWDNAIQEIISATIDFMEEYIKIYEKYSYDN